MIKFLVILLLLFSTSAFALEEEVVDEFSGPLTEYIDQFITLPPGALDWKLLGTTEETQQPTKDDNGVEYTYSKPVFPSAVQALNGKTVTIKGFMFPLEEDEAQGYFLIGPFPLSCPYHYHVGPSLVIEVKMTKGKIKFTEEPIMVQGTMELVPDDPEYGSFYRLQNAEEVKQ